MTQLHLANSIRDPSRGRPTLVGVHLWVYIEEVKRAELERALKQAGWRFQRHEINEITAKAILKQARGGKK